MFAFGVGVIILAFIVDIKWGKSGIGFNWAYHVARWGKSGIGFNWAYHVARWGCVAGALLCSASILLWLWRVLP